MDAFPRWPKIVLTVALVVLLAGSVWLYRSQKQRRAGDALENLEAIAQLKIDWIREWRKERFVEANQIMASRFYGPLAARWRRESPQEKEMAAVLFGFRSARAQRNYADALFTDPAGKAMVRLSGRSSDLAPESLHGLQEAFRQRKVRMTSLYADPDTARPRIDVIAPFFSGEGDAAVPVGAIIYQYEAHQSLYPAIQSWPVRSDSAETLLVRREGDAVLFLNELRHQKGTALKLRLPVGGGGGSWAQALRQARGTVAGIDYRGVNVLAVVRPVPDTDWILIAQQDEVEIFAALRQEFTLLLIGILLLITSISAALVVLWQRKSRIYYRALFEAEAAQRKAEERIRSTMDGMLEGCQIIGFDWRHIYLNAIGLKHSGRTWEELRNHSILELYPGIENTDVFAAFRRCMEERTPQHVAAASVHLDGEERSYEIRIQPIPEGIFALTRDVTERKRIETENARLASAIAQLGEVVVIVDTARIVRYVNPVFESVTGFAPEEVLGKPLPTAGEQDEAFYREFWDTLESGRQWKGRIRNRRKDGTLYTEDATVSPVFDSSGAIVNFVSITRDISEFLRLQEEKEKLQSQYLQAQKMESVGRLAGGVAHDFNNMLNVIIGYAQLALDKLDPGQMLHSYLQEIYGAALRSADLTRQLLAFARRQTIAPKVLNLNQTVGGMMSMLQRIIGEDIDLSWIPGLNLWPVKMDPSQIDQMLANLAVNARDAISAQGRITIETANVSFDESYHAEHMDSVAGDYVMLALSDNGCGMDQEVKDHLFEPFFTTKERGKGTGLGLATVYGIVRQNAGFINIYSEPGKGTTFKIYLPRHSGAEAASTAGAKADRPKGGTETILLVEDEAAVLKLTKIMLERLGYSVIAANSPRAALELADECAGELHLLLVDVVMPEMTGRELAERLGTKFPKLRRLFMSGYTANVIAHHGVLDEGVFFIQKPFSSGSLAAKVREVLDGA